MLKSIGGVLIAIGVISVGYALGMEVTARYSSVYNTGLLAERHIYVIIGCALSIIGSMSVLFGILIDAIGVGKIKNRDGIENKKKDQVSDLVDQIIG